MEGARLTLKYNDTGVKNHLPKTTWLKSCFNDRWKHMMEIDGIIGEIVLGALELLE